MTEKPVVSVIPGYNGGNEIQCAPGGIGVPRGLTWKVSAPMFPESTPRQPKTTTTYVCEHCQAAFVPKSRSSNRPHRFCSVDCRNGFWRARRMRTCDQCGQSFEMKRSRSEDGPHRGRFCSFDCYGLWQQGRQFEHRTRRFNPTVRFGAAWLETRARILDRDGHACQSCGGTVDLHVHHIEPYAPGQPDPHRESNLVTLCHPCHARTHAVMEGKTVTGPYWTTCTHRDEFRRPK